MKIKYEFVTGEVVEVEVDDAIGNVIRESRVKEESYERKMRRHCYALDAVETEDKSEWFWDQAEDITEKLSAKEELNMYREMFLNSVESLTDKQYEILFAILYEGKTQAEYARETGQDKGLVSRRLCAAIKKIQKKSKNY